jgi:hypothetical protein
LLLHLISPCIRGPKDPGTERKQTLAGLSNPKYHRSLSVCPKRY